MAKQDPKKARKTKKVKDPNKPGRIKQIRQSYTMTKQTDPKIGLILLGVFLLAGLAAFAVMLLVFNSLYFPILFGVLTGILAFIVSFQVPKDMGRSAFIVQAVVTVVLGVLIMAWPDATLTVISVILAALLIVFGLVLLMSGYQLSKGVTRIGPAES